MNTEVMFSSKSDNWATPADFFRALDAEFHFTVDVCASKENAKCPAYFTKEQDGLAQEWRGGGILVQSPIRPRNRPLGAESVGGCRYRRNALTGQNRHGVVSRLHLRQGGDPFCSRPLEIRRLPKQRTVSQRGLYFQKAGGGG